ncbi:MAG: hypothetical protein AAB525_00110 [Patescibacteria group bacterium]
MPESILIKHYVKENPNSRNETVDFKKYFKQMQKLFKFFDSHEKFYDQFIKISGEKIEAVNKRTKGKVIIV